jgi:hypothetical protein
MMGAAVTADQVRRPAAGAEFIHTPVKSGNDLRMVCQAQVVITAEGQTVAAIDANLHTLRAVEDLPAAIQMVCPAGLQLCRKVSHTKGAGYIFLDLGDDLDIRV